MKIEILLVLALALVFIIDFFVRKKKNSTSEIEKSVQKSTEKSYSKPNILKKIILAILIVFTIAGPLIFDLWIYMTSYDLYVFLDNPVLYLDDLYYHQYLFLNTYLIHFIFLIITLAYGIYFFRKDKVSNETSVNKRFLHYISKRPKNLTLFSIFVFLSKLCIHYFLYAKQKPPPVGVVFYEGDIFYEEFVWHLENILTVEVKLFIPAFIFMCLMVWFFNDKIKAR